MTKQSKTAEELASLIRKGLGYIDCIGRLRVIPDAINGWSAAISTDPRFQHQCQARVERIVVELRANFELKQ